MSLSLFLDTTQATLMLMLADDSKVLARHSEAHTSYRYHSTILLPVLSKLLAEHQKTARDITHLALNMGPGSFTGIRTGLTVARILGQFLPMNLFAMNTFELIAAHPVFRGKTVTVLLNASRQQHYHAVLTVSQSGETHWTTAPFVCPNEAPPEIHSEVVIQEAFLQDKLPWPSTMKQPPLILENTDWFSPEAMQFLMQHQATRFAVTWETLKPLYLQLPNITMSKKQQPA